MNQKLIDLSNDYIHGDRPRRSFLRRAAQLAGTPAYCGNHLA